MKCPTCGFECMEARDDDRCDIPGSLDPATLRAELEALRVYRATSEIKYASPEALVGWIDTITRMISEREAALKDTPTPKGHTT